MDQPVEKLSHIERAAMAELKALLAQQYGVRDIRLFGSKARGTGHAESDLDVFIVMPDLDWECAKAIYTLCFDLSLRYDLLIAPTLCSQAEFEHPSSRRRRSTGPSRQRECLYKRCLNELTGMCSSQREKEADYA
jgi:predicted nucleotidyltransferase